MTNLEIFTWKKPDPKYPSYFSWKMMYVYIDLGFCFLPSQARPEIDPGSLDTIPAGVSIQEWNDAADLELYTKLSQDLKPFFGWNTKYIEVYIYIYNSGVFGVWSLTVKPHFPSSQERQLRKNWRRLASRSWGPAHHVLRALVTLVQWDFPYMFVLNWGFQTDSSTIYIPAMWGLSYIYIYIYNLSIFIIYIYIYKLVGIPI